jgi:hypothetical protein
LEFRAFLSFFYRKGTKNTKGWRTTFLCLENPNRVGNPVRVTGKIDFVELKFDFVDLKILLIMSKKREFCRTPMTLLFPVKSKNRQVTEIFRTFAANYNKKRYVTY